MENVLVTGALGCIGAWTLHHLLERDQHPVSFDISDNRKRLDLLLDEDAQSKITFVNGDLTDFEQVKRTFEQHDITHVIHLAALQVPFVRANPVLGSQVNVTGTTNIFEAARQCEVPHIAYASSIAVYGPQSDYPPGLVAHDAPRLPRTLYGVFKVANEDTARIFYQNHGLTSLALRPYTVYGPGRDQGLTSEPTAAMQAAARGENYDITFGGQMQFHFASDVAQQFIDAALNPSDGAHAFTLGGPVTPVTDVAQLIIDAKPGVTVTVADNELPFPAGFDDSALREHVSTVYETPLADGIARTIRHFEERV